MELNVSLYVFLSLSFIISIKTSLMISHILYHDLNSDLSKHLNISHTICLIVSGSPYLDPHLNQSRSHNLNFSLTRPRTLSISLMIPLTISVSFTRFHDLPISFIFSFWKSFTTSPNFLFFPTLSIANASWPLTSSLDLSVSISFNIILELLVHPTSRHNYLDIG